MRPTYTLVLLAATALVCADAGHSQSAPPQGRPRDTQGPFSISQVKSYPFPTGLTAARTGARIAWALNEQGRRNIWVAEGPAFAPRRLTTYMADDGQDLTSVSVSPDGKYVVYLRGGDFGSNFDDAMPVNPAATPAMPKVQIWSVPFAGGEPAALGEGESPVISSNSDVVAFERDRQIWVVPIDGSAAARKLFTARGSNGGAVWSPAATPPACLATRGALASIGICAHAA